MLRGFCGVLPAAMMASPPRDRAAARRRRWLLIRHRSGCSRCDPDARRTAGRFLEFRIAAFNQADHVVADLLEMTSNVLSMLTLTRTGSDIGAIASPFSALARTSANLTGPALKSASKNVSSPENCGVTTLSTRNRDVMSAAGSAGRRGRLEQARAPRFAPA